MGLLDAVFGGAAKPVDPAKMDAMRKPGIQSAPDQPPEGLAYATFAGGCFWGVELAYQRVPGVVKTAVGYTQGPTPAPTYEMVCSGQSGHTEAVLVTYNPQECTYAELLRTFVGRVDMSTVNGQGNDRGTQYRTGIYWHSDEQKVAAEALMAEVEAKGKVVATEVKKADTFWVAEKYHQQYLEKGGRLGNGQSAKKGCTDPIRCYG